LEIKKEELPDKKEMKRPTKGYRFLAAGSIALFFGVISLKSMVQSTHNLVNSGEVEYHKNYRSLAKSKKKNYQIKGK
jgi:hypothetical protein